MNRPKILHVGGVLYWTIRTRNPDTQVLKDADSTPTVAVRKNGASTGDFVTITKRTATTGIYDCSYNPAGEVEGDEFTIEESVTVTGTTTSQATYSASWEFVVIAVERGTNGANTVAPDNAGLAAIKIVTDRINTGLVADGPVWQFTANMLELSPAASGGGLTTEQEDTLNGIASDLNSFATVAARLAVEGKILGFPAAIVRNADYHADAGSDIPLTVADLTGEPITEIAGTPLASVSWLFGMGTERNPRLITGTATWATDRLKIEWLAAATANKPLGTLTWQVGATIDGKTRWFSGGTTRLIERQF